MALILCTQKLTAKRMFTGWPSVPQIHIRLESWGGDLFGDWNFAANLLGGVLAEWMGSVLRREERTLGRAPRDTGTNLSRAAASQGMPRNPGGGRRAPTLEPSEGSSRC